MFKLFATMTCALMLAGCAGGLPSRIPTYSSLTSGGVPPQSEPDVDFDALAEDAMADVDEGDSGW